MAPRNFGKKRGTGATPPKDPAQQQANDKAQVKQEIFNQLSERLTELSLDGEIFKGWMREVLREELLGFFAGYERARYNYLLAVGGDKRDKPAATADELKFLLGEEEFAKLQKIDWAIGRRIE